MKYVKSIFISMTVLVFIFLLSGCANPKESEDKKSNDKIGPKTLYISLTIPNNLANNVVLNKNITAMFSEEMSPATINNNTFILKQESNIIACSVKYVRNLATLDPKNDLMENTTYSVTITKDVKALTGNAMSADKVWRFTTGKAKDYTAPTVNYITPDNLAANVAVDTNIIATFSEVIDAPSITNQTFILTRNTTYVECVLIHAGNVAVLNPTRNLLANTKYNVIITNGILDLAGNSMTYDKNWSFTTGPSSESGPASVELGSADNFVLLAKTGIDTVPTSTVKGDIGISPSAASYITGFSLTMDASNIFSQSNQITGRVFAANYSPPTPANMTKAISDMETAYKDAAGRLIPDFTELGNGNISGLTLVPGLYKWSTGVLVTKDVTIHGGANAVWIFQIAGELTLASGTKIILTGGAQAKNIFWQVTDSVAINTNAHLEGITMSAKKITLATSASANGRLMSQAAISLDGNTVLQP